MEEPQSEVDLARTEARRGNVGHALPVLARHAEAGDDSAAASAAELSAYLWRWNDVIPQAGRLIANPLAVYAGNVGHELTLLLIRAGHETGDWRGIARVADAAYTRLAADLRANPWGFPKTKIEGLESQLLSRANDLGEYALGEGRTRPQRTVGIFAPRRQTPRPDLFEQALKGKRNQRSPQARLIFACMYHLDDEIIRAYETMDGNIPFTHALPVAKAFLRRSDHAMAWHVLRTYWTDWAPVDQAQTTPLDPLIDEAFADFITRDRAMELVRTPRAGFLAA